MLKTTPYDPEDGPGVNLDNDEIVERVTAAIRPLHAEIVQTLLEAGAGRPRDEDDPTPLWSCQMQAASYLHTALVEALRTLRAE